MQVHITNGSSAAGLLMEALALSNDEIMVVNDLLSCGPLIASSSDDAWIASRQTYWDELLTLCALEPFPLSDFKRDFYFHYRELHSAAAVHLWLGTELADQLMLAFVVSKLSHINFDLDKLRIHQFDRVNDRSFEIVGIGLLDAPHIRNDLLGKPLSTVAIDSLKRSWEILTSSNMRNISALIHQPIEELPYFSQSLSCLMNRLPDWQTGLNLWQEKLLRLCQETTTRAVKIIGALLQETFDTRDQVGDLYLFSQMKKLGNPRLKQAPLVLVDDQVKMHDTHVSLSSFGQALLNGSANFIAVNGFDDYFGGVHLSSLEPQLYYRRNDEIIEMI